MDREAIDDQIRNILQKLEDAGVSEAIGLTEELRRFLRMRQEELRQKALDLPDVENGTSGSKENS